MKIIKFNTKLNNSSEKFIPNTPTNLSIDESNLGAHIHNFTRLHTLSISSLEWLPITNIRLNLTKLLKRSSALSLKVASDNTISRVRSRVEHVFGLVEQSPAGSTVRSTQKIRTTFNILLASAVWNICKLGQLDPSRIAVPRNFHSENLKRRSRGMSQRYACP